MTPERNYFAQLAGQVRSGNAHARAELQTEMEPCLLRIMARALDPKAPPSPLHRQLQGLIREQGGADASQQRRLAQVLSQRVVRRLTPDG
jgi:hypothetical protein